MLKCSPGPRMPAAMWPLFPPARAPQVALTQRGAPLPPSHRGLARRPVRLPRLPRRDLQPRAATVRWDPKKYAQRPLVALQKQLAQQYRVQMGSMAQAYVQRTPPPGTSLHLLGAVNVALCEHFTCEQQATQSAEHERQLYRSILHLQRLMAAPLDPFRVGMEEALQTEWHTFKEYLAGRRRHVWERRQRAGRVAPLEELLPLCAGMRTDVLTEHCHSHRQHGRYRPERMQAPDLTEEQQWLLTAEQLCEWLLADRDDPYAQSRTLRHLRGISREVGGSHVWGEALFDHCMAACYALRAHGADAYLG